MNPRLRRLLADYKKIQDEFTRHPFIDVDPIMGNPPEKYQISYKVKGIKELDNNARPVYSNHHLVTIYLHSEYPRQKPKCEILTPIWHPNFGNYICIGDHWGAGETLVDIIVQIGDMIQYRSYNPKSPLNASAAVWAKHNEYLFPIGNIDLYQPEPEIEIFEDEEFGITLRPVKKVKKEVRDDLDIEFH
jgi:ubiquitin-protein ligase